MIGSQEPFIGHCTDERSVFWLTDDVKWLVTEVCTDVWAFYFCLQTELKRWRISGECCTDVIGRHSLVYR